MGKITFSHSEGVYERFWDFSLAKNDPERGQQLSGRREARMV
jgi:hypothetical protein